MKSRLKNLYKYLIENRKHEVKGWHDAYREFYGEVEKIRERIRAGETLVLIAKDQDKKSFLKQLLFDDNNGIAARGQSTLSHVNFGKYIPRDYQVEAVLEEIRIETEKGRRVLVTTLTKHLAEELTKYLNDIIKNHIMNKKMNTISLLKALWQLRSAAESAL